MTGKISGMWYVGERAEGHAWKLDRFQLIQYVHLVAAEEYHISLVELNDLSVLPAVGLGGSTRSRRGK
jgi:hypothetical protein